MNFQSIDLLELGLVTLDKSVSLFELHIVCSITHSCPTLCNPKDCSPPSSSVYGILQARILGWVAIAFSRPSSQCRDQTHVSCVSCIAGRFFTTEPLGKPLLLLYWGASYYLSSVMNRLDLLSNISLNSIT